MKRSSERRSESRRRECLALLQRWDELDQVQLTDVVLRATDLGITHDTQNQDVLEKATIRLYKMGRRTESPLQAVQRFLKRCGYDEEAGTGPPDHEVDLAAVPPPAKRRCQNSGGDVDAGDDDVDEEEEEDEEEEDEEEDEEAQAPEKPPGDDGPAPTTEKPPSDDGPAPVTTGADGDAAAP